MPKSELPPVDTRQKPIAGYIFNPYWFGCNGRTINGLCGDSFKDEQDLLKRYDSVFGRRGHGNGLTRVYTDGTTFKLRTNANQNFGESDVSSNPS